MCLHTALQTEGNSPCPHQTKKCHIPVLLLCYTEANKSCWEVGFTGWGSQQLHLLAFSQLEAQAKQAYNSSELGQK